MNISNDNLNEVEQGDFRRFAECYSKFDINWPAEVTPKKAAFKRD